MGHHKKSGCKKSCCHPKHKKPTSTSYVTNNLSLAANKNMIFLGTDGSKNYFGVQGGISAVGGDMKEKTIGGAYAVTVKNTGLMTQHHHIELAQPPPAGSMFGIVSVPTSQQIVAGQFVPPAPMPLTVSMATGTNTNFHAHYTNSFQGKTNLMPILSVPIVSVPTFNTTFNRTLAQTPIIIPGDVIPPSLLNGKINVVLSPTPLPSQPDPNTF